jgi:hypothetical protein
MSRIAPRTSSIPVGTVTSSVTSSPHVAVVELEPFNLVPSLSIACDVETRKLSPSTYSYLTADLSMNSFGVAPQCPPSMFMYPPPLPAATFPYGYAGDYNRVNGGPNSCAAQWSFGSSTSFPAMMEPTMGFVTQHGHRPQPMSALSAKTYMPYVQGYSCLDSRTRQYPHQAQRDEQRNGAHYPPATVSQHVNALRTDDHRRTWGTTSYDRGSAEPMYERTAYPSGGEMRGGAKRDRESRNRALSPTTREDSSAQENQASRVTSTDPKKRIRVSGAAVAHAHNQSIPAEDRFSGWYPRRW